MSWFFSLPRIAVILSAFQSQVEDQEVLAITFNPDKAVACFPPPQQPVLLTKGRAPKRIRRGGMNGRGVKGEVMSIPDTAGEYEDWAVTE